MDKKRNRIYLTIDPAPENDLQGTKTTNLTKMRTAKNHVKSFRIKKGKRHDTQKITKNNKKIRRTPNITTNLKTIAIFDPP